MQYWGKITSGSHNIPCKLPECWQNRSDSWVHLVTWSRWWLQLIMAIFRPCDGGRLQKSTEFQMVIWLYDDLGQGVPLQSPIALWLISVWQQSFRIWLDTGQVVQILNGSVPGTVAKFSCNTGHTLNVSRKCVSTGQEVVRTGRSHLSTT